MAIKAADQITITDITDAYSVILTSEAFTFVGGTGGAPSGSICSTQAVAYCGTNQCNSVNVSQNDIKFYKTDGTEITSGISAVVTNSGTSTVTISFTLSSILSDALEVDIPVVVDGITIHKKFSLSVAKTGQQGSTGDPGEDAITLSVTSSNGTVFKNNSDSTVLTAHVYKAGTEKTINPSTGVVEDNIGTIKWYKGSPTDTQPTGFPKSAKTLSISATDVVNVQPYTCQLEN